MKDLETERTRIRKFRIEDAEDIYNNIATIKKLEDCYNYNMHKNVEETRGIILSSIKEYELGEPIWAIEEKKSGIVVGYIKATEISKENGRCNLNFGIGLKWLKDKLLEESIEEAMNYLMYEEFIRKTRNNILKNIGMRQEAILRNRKINNKTGKPENLIIFSITKEEMQKQKVS